jgi:hypothetical protein
MEHTAILQFVDWRYNERLYRSSTGHAKNFFWTACGGGGGVFGLFLIQIYKKCNEGGGGGLKSEKNS